MKTALRPQGPKVLWESEISVLFLWGEGIDAESLPAGGLASPIYNLLPNNGPDQHSRI